MHRFTFVIVCLVSSTFLTAGAVLADEAPHPSQLLPSTTALYIEARDTDELIPALMEHPVLKLVQQWSEYQQAMESTEFNQFMAVVRFLEQRTDVQWPAALERLTHGGVCFAADPVTKGVVILTRGADDRLGPQIVKELTSFLGGLGQSIPKIDYRGQPVYKGEGQAKLCIVGSWIVATNNDDLGRQVVDRLLDGGSEHLAQNQQFREAQAQRSRDASLWAYVNVKTLRDAGIAKQLFQQKTDNPVGELLIGGLLGTLSNTPYVTLAGSINSTRLALHASSPHESEWISEAREYYFGTPGSGDAPALVETEDTVLSLSAYRKISDMWLRAGDLFDENAQDELAKADSGLSTLFAGKDFGEDVLGAIGPKLQLIVDRQAFSKVRPEIRLPSFALLGSFEKPEKVRDDFRRTFQSMVGFFNVLGAMEGNPQLDLQTENQQNAKLFWADFVPDALDDDEKNARIHFNFSPALALKSERFIISSSERLARTLIDPKRIGATPTGKHNLDMRLHASNLARVLEDNAEQLIAQNMLEEGNNRDEATQHVKRIIDLVRVFRDARLTVGVPNETLDINFVLANEG